MLFMKKSNKGKKMDNDVKLFKATCELECSDKMSEDSLFEFEDSLNLGIERLDGVVGSYDIGNPLVELESISSYGNAKRNKYKAVIGFEYEGSLSADNLWKLVKSVFEDSGCKVVNNISYEMEEEMAESSKKKAKLKESKNFGNDCGPMKNIMKRCAEIRNARIESVKERVQKNINEDSTVNNVNMGSGAKGYTPKDTEGIYTSKSGKKYIMGVGDNANFKKVDFWQDKKRASKEVGEMNDKFGSEETYDTPISTTPTKGGVTPVNKAKDIWKGVRANKDVSNQNEDEPKDSQKVNVKPDTVPSNPKSYGSGLNKPEKASDKWSGVRANKDVSNQNDKNPKDSQKRESFNRKSRLGEDKYSDMAVGMLDGGSKIKDINKELVNSIARDSRASYEFADSSIRKGYKLNELPKEIIQSISRDPYFSYEFALMLVKYSGYKKEEIPQEIIDSISKDENLDKDFNKRVSRRFK